MLDDFGVAAGNRDAGRFGGLRHGPNFGFQHIRGQSGFQDKGDDKRFRAARRKPPDRSRCH